MGYSPKGCKELETTERLSMHTIYRFNGTGFLLGTASVVLLATLPTFSHTSSSERLLAGESAGWNLHGALSHCLEESHTGDLLDLHQLVI